MNSSPEDLPIVDLHSHLVPGVDDGSASIEESLDSLRALHAEGVRTLVTTPHLLVPRLVDRAAIDHELEHQREAFESLVAAVEGRSDVPVLGLGQEIWVPDAAGAGRIARHPEIGLAGTRSVLVEFGFDLEGTHLPVVHELVAAGRQVIIAHPERYRYLPGTEPLELMRRWRDAGALLQVNAGSLCGYYRHGSPAAEQLAWSMVEAGLADLIASDHHGVRRFGVSPREALTALISRGHGAAAERLFCELPREAVREWQTVHGRR